jgi:predicted permease
MTPESPKWYQYLRFWRANVAADVDAELAFHVDARAHELCELGLDRAAARAQALREFGDVEGVRRQLRMMDERHATHERRANVATDLTRDIRVAVRALSRSPGLVAIVVLTLALGIGITSAIYSVVDAYLFRPLPGANGGDLVVLGRTEKEIPQPHDLSFPDFRDYRADTAVFQSLAAYTSRIVNLGTDRGADRIWVDDATANYFALLGLRPMLGRTFAPDDGDGVLAHPDIVLTYKGWQTHFAGDSSVVGRVLRINDHPVTVIGVMPPEFHGVRPIVDIDAVACLNQIWPAYGAVLEDRSAITVSVFGRLHEGVSVERARQAVRLRARQLERAYPATNKNVDAVLVPERYSRPSITVASAMPALATVFMSLVLLVLFVACANVASLLIARVVGRGRELAIRAAIGASHWRLVRQVLVECVLLALLGGLVAVGVAAVAIRALASIHLATDMPMRWGVQLDARVLAFTVLATLLAALLAGIAPASATRKRNLNELLKSSAGNSGTRAHQRLRSTLVVTQIAVSVVVLVCAGLFARSSANATHMNLGFRSDHRLMLSTSLPAQRYDSSAGRALYREVLRRAGSVPGVRSVAIARFVPFGYELDMTTIVPIAPAVPVPENGFSYLSNIIGGDYFETMGIPLLVGRAFTERDDARAPAVAVVNDALARAVWPGQPAVGKRFHVGTAKGPIVEIVGVVRGMQTFFPGEVPKPYLFVPVAQSYRSEMTLIAHTEVPPSSASTPLREAITALDPNLPVYDVRSLDEHLRNGQAFLFTRIGSAFASVFGLLALLLATIGVYGVVSYSVAQRTREIGVRVALGAHVPAILRLVVGQGLRLGWIGIAAGVMVSLATTGILSSVLLGVAPRDPLVIAGVIGVLTIVVAVASLVPARRAARIDPRLSLRAE